MALVCKADLVSQHAGNKPAHGVCDHHGRQLAAREHKIAERNFFVHAFVNEALVDALVVPADKHHVFIVALDLLRLFLVENIPAGGKKNRMHRRAHIVADRAPAAIQGIAL